MNIPFFGGGKQKWMSPAVKQMMEISSVRADGVFLKTCKVLALVKVKPVNFGALQEGDKDSVIYGFLELLNNLTFPIQIVMRTTNLDLEDYLGQLKKRIQKRDDKMALAYYEHFSEYMRAHIKINKIRDRLFYIVISIDKSGGDRVTLKELSSRCDTLMNALSVSGIVTERMNTHQLINFYSSYFTESFEIYDSFISPMTLYKQMWGESSKLRQKKQIREKEQIQKGKPIAKKAEKGKK
ncbi:MAG: TraC family protein [Candidatus Altiarchaeota archaeon]